MNTIPFNLPSVAGNELAYMAEAIAAGKISGDGPFGRRAQALIGEILGGAASLLTTSCTHALEMSAFLLDLRAGDEVIVPSFTFVSTANAYALRGAKIVFVDISPQTLNIDPAAVEAAITPRTKAIVAVHYAGVACDLDALLAIVERHGIALIEDNAHGFFGSYRGRPLGTFGRFSTLSFHETKNVYSGEGGAIVLNDANDIARAEILREKGTNRSRFFRGMVDKYSWVDLGSSYVQSDILAAFLLGQLESRERVQDARKTFWERYDRELGALARAGAFRGPVVPVYAGQSYHMYYLLLPTARERTDFIAFMHERGISCVFHYLPLHRSDFARSHGFDRVACPVTDDVADRLVRLPMYSTLDGAQERVIESVVHFSER